ncbi:ryncolin-1-like isoform X2 [Scylla paramamosain]|uniref:ryncolin-1-like isoform X2 n=1 Tax=Scylla paramamosain TaxID=85552 RepID=UPI00308275F8
MQFLVFLAMGVAVAQASATPPTAEENSCSGLKDDRSLLSSLLAVTGYSDACVAAALDFCSSGQEDSRYASLMEEAREVVQEVSASVNKWGSAPRNCKDLLDSGDSGSGLRQVYPYLARPHQSVLVFCNHTVDGGGWTVFQRRSSELPRQDFYRAWIEYQLGFGDIEGEFWLGLEVLHHLTSTTVQELRIDLDDYEGGHRWAKYGYFHVGTSETNFRLSVGRRRGGYWYDACTKSNLNGFQYMGNYTSFADGINWYSWKGRQYSLKGTSMMIRPSTH